MAQAECDRVGATAYKWYGFTSFVTLANTATPTLVQSQFTEKPMHYGQVCTGGTLCIASLGDRRQPLFIALNKIDLVKKPKLLGISVDLTTRLDPEIDPAVALGTARGPER